MVMRQMKWRGVHHKNAHRRKWGHPCRGIGGRESSHNWAKPSVSSYYCCRRSMILVNASVSVPFQAKKRVSCKAGQSQVPVIYANGCCTFIGLYTLHGERPWQLSGAWFHSCAAPFFSQSGKTLRSSIFVWCLFYQVLNCSCSLHVRESSL